MDPTLHFPGCSWSLWSMCRADQLYLRLLSVTCRSPGAGIGMPTSSSAAGEWQLSPVPWATVPRAACGTSTSLTISATKTEGVTWEERVESRRSCGQSAW